MKQSSIDSEIGVGDQENVIHQYCKQILQSMNRQSEETQTIQVIKLLIHLLLDISKSPFASTISYDSFMCSLSSFSHY